MSIAPPSVAPSPLPQSGLLGVHAAALRLAIPLDETVEVFRMVELMPFPDGPPAVIGIMVYRGVIVPVLDPTAKLAPSMRIEPGLDSHLVVINSGGRTAALVVDEVDGVLDADRRSFVPRAQFLSGEALSARPCLRGTVRASDGLLLVVDPWGLLSDLEEAELAARLLGEGEVS